MDPNPKGHPTVVLASNFNASNDATILRKAMKGFGTDNAALISVLCHRSCDQRIEIAKAFKTEYGKDLIADIRSETSGNFENVLVSLLTPTIEFYCNELFRAMDGIGTDENVLIDVICTLNNQDMKEINERFQKKFSKTLESYLRGDTSGFMKRLMTSLSTGNRDESMKTDLSSAQQDASALKKSRQYQKLAGNTLENDIKREFSGDIEEALLAIVRYANNPAEFFARRLHKSMAGLGTNDRSLIRLCVLRCEIDMADIKDAFQRLYGKSLASFIKGDCSGNYKKSLLALCGEN
ncbi:unnamed protein product [Chironomus riparius]|uniref:Annexin n=1 Tax=Chironomus riparius TaxID=315576 RepID=A0A9N9RRR3_9DIPT|nr:unnamed protein product [Chironomus riparius]